MHRDNERPPTPPPPGVTLGHSTLLMTHPAHTRVHPALSPRGSSNKPTARLDGVAVELGVPATDCDGLPTTMATHGLGLNESTVAAHTRLPESSSSSTRSPKSRSEQGSPQSPMSRPYTATRATSASATHAISIHGVLSSGLDVNMSHGPQTEKPLLKNPSTAFAGPNCAASPPLIELDVAAA